MSQCILYRRGSWRSRSEGRLVPVIVDEDALLDNLSQTEEQGPPLVVVRRDRGCFNARAIKRGQRFPIAFEEEMFL